MPQKRLILRKKARRNFVQQEIAFRAAREILKFPTFCRYTVKNKGVFLPAIYSACVVLVLKQLFTSVSVIAVDIYRAAPPLR